MFFEARLKLTAWYVLIIMLISVIFSGVIYSVISRELERGFRQAEEHFYQERYGLFIPPPGRLQLSFNREMQTAKKRVFFRLVLANSIIFIFSAGSGYFLAGKTLRPIESALEEQKRFVDDASHELKTPLTALRTSIEVALRDKKLSLKEAKTTLSGSLAEVEGLVNLTGNLLSLTENQTNNRHMGSVSVRQLVEKSVKKIKPLADKKKISMVTSIREATIHGQIMNLEEMMLIFFDNAVKYTPAKGKIMVTTLVDRKYATIRIKDSGMGIKKEDMPHIFDRFYRADQSRSRDNVPGFGLGLSLAKKIISQHHGSVEVQSQLNKGTVFDVKLPIRT